MPQHTHYFAPPGDVIGIWIWICIQCEQCLGDKLSHVPCAVVFQRETQQIVQLHYTVCPYKYITPFIPYTAIPMCCVHQDLSILHPYVQPSSPYLSTPLYPLPLSSLPLLPPAPFLPLTTQTTLLVNIHIPTHHAFPCNHAFLEIGVPATTWRGGEFVAAETVGRYAHDVSGIAHVCFGGWFGEVVGGLVEGVEVGSFVSMLIVTWYFV
ncbi:hypothetical protein T440DRAFT_13116 [Plenodomus tracheiphilus IPT5]|uniref:Uncharacterized protein n=1 Tax=Plenodomus tracheiphilus IPT5 TaxID=1408161 RepID=A0A6A7BQH9_9PLEO|nr:hypothetical protein T440DRAFT_13116 [Plenodomus tracheiphilus IPT5]